MFGEFIRDLVQLPKSLFQRSCQQSSCRELLRRSCQETSYRDLCRRSCREVSYRDLARRHLMEICTETWWREPVSCAEISYREFEQGSYFEIFNSDLLWKFLLGYTDSLAKGSCTAASIENLSRRSCARSSTEIFTKGTCQIQPGIFTSRDHLEWTQGFTTWVALVLLAWSPWCFWVLSTSPLES